jgi:uncharacterized Zn finger protein
MVDDLKRLDRWMTAGLDEKSIRAVATAEVFARGKTYWKSGAVSGLKRRGDILSAEVEGSEDEPYIVTVELARGRALGMSCTCPYEWDGVCKHVVAVLLAFAADEARVPKLKPVAELLAPLDRDRLLALLTKRLDSDPHLASWLDAELAAPPPRAGAPKAKIDTAPISRQAHALLGARYRDRRYWDGYRASGDLAELQQLTAQAVPFLEAGDGRNALKILRAVTDAFVSDWIAYSSGSDEHMYELFNDLGRMLAEASIMADFDAGERERYAKLVAGWEDDLSDYGDFEGFGTALLALRADLDSPGLRAVLSGAQKTWPPDGNAAWEDRDFVGVVLRNLDAQDRRDGYLNLALAAGEKECYGAMLIKCGRMAEALGFALTALKTPGQALTLAQSFDAAGSSIDALAVARRGLEFTGSPKADWQRAKLAGWLRDRAAALGDHALAVSAAETCFALTLSYEIFVAAETAAGPLWAECRPRLLATLARAGRCYDRPVIYLRAGMIDAAVAVALEDRDASAHDSALMELAEAAGRSHPDWVIGLARRLADQIMEQGQAGLYDIAARWLALAASAYEDDGRDEEWRGVLERLIATHRRKNKLRALLEALR